MSGIQDVLINNKRSKPIKEAKKDKKADFKSMVKKALKDYGKD